ncbi:4949_t:CDS:10 [Acaulospora colombiana]|uniref:4949_t:CDS:1 n=1 Tax=Acaulospora colombiana TaxID=27376 RepID=A0ACA9LUB1_9GLOM|nr:4949_t:CDS:10 [Acaulospora colombiana]
MGRHSFPVLNQQFLVDEKYQFIRELGQGAYGVVCAARNILTGEGVAIKKVTNVFNKTILTKRALREVKLLQHFRGHKNILSGLKYIHSANVLHRDLKPGQLNQRKRACIDAGRNLLVNADCELKICDFGLARGFSEDPAANSGFMTEYVATRWYRAPEIMLSFQSYTKAIDLWSVGCILAELLGGRPLFKGRDYVDQLNQILQTLGTPSDATLTRIGSPRAQEYIRNLPYMHKKTFQQLFPGANHLALDLLERLLTFDPAQRITVEEALEHPYLAVWHDPNDEPTCSEPFDFSFESVDDPDQMRVMIAQEVSTFRALVRRQHVPQLSVATGRTNTSSGLSKIPDRDTILNSPTVVRGDVNALAADHYQASSIHRAVTSEDLERELSGAMDVS